MDATTPRDQHRQVSCLRHAAEFADAVLLATADASDVEVLPGVDAQGLRQHLMEVVAVFAGTADPTPGRALVETVELVVARLDEAPPSAWGAWGSRDAACWTLIGELLVHSWDVMPAATRPLPAEPAPCADLATVICEPLVAIYRERGTVGPAREAPPGSSSLERLAALYGRASGPGARKGRPTRSAR